MPSGIYLLGQGSSTSRLVIKFNKDGTKVPSFRFSSIFVSILNAGNFSLQLHLPEKDFVNNRRDVFAQPFSENEVGTLAIGVDAPFAGFQVYAVIYF